MNPIELVWHAIKVRCADVNPQTVEELKTAICGAWEDHLDVQQCNRYISHNFKALKKVVEVKGGYTGM